MTEKTLRRWTAVIALVLAAVAAGSIIANNFVILLVAVVLAMAVTYMLRRSVAEVTKDERTALLYEKAAWATIRFCVPMAALVSILLVALRDRLSVEMVAAGYVLAYVACALLLAHSAFYSFYNRKH